MLNEEEKGYPVSDDAMSDADYTDSHQRILMSSNPAYTNLRKLHVESDLGLDKGVLRTGPLEEKPSMVSPEQKDTASGQSMGDDKLSPFTQWLVELRRPEVHPTVSLAPEISVEVPDETEILQSEQAAEVTSARKDKKAGKKKKKKKKKKGTEEQVKDDQIVLSDEVFSETLAELLASQGHTNQAIEMYEKLRLIYPEKSRLFAAKIEELHKKA